MNITIFGAPGSGKGTQAKKIMKEYGYFHISTGDFLRERAKVLDIFGKQIKELIDHGLFIPDDLMIRLFEEIVNNNISVPGFVFDGYPRTLPQIDAFEDFLQQQFPGVNTTTIFLEVEEEELISRILGRAVIELRADDATRSNIQDRIAIFKEKTLPVVAHYAALGTLKTVVGTDKTSTEVWNEVQQVINTV
ncbi:MAG: nucleoside monophosphate kinase [bacterium]